jgi:hypothetical protein
VGVADGAPEAPVDVEAQPGTTESPTTKSGTDTASRAALLKLEKRIVTRNYA